MSKAKTLIKSSGLRIILFFANVIIALFMMPFVIRSLGDKMYGLWITIGSFMGYYGLFDFGLGSVVQRFVSSAIGRRDYKEANVCINTMFFLYSFIGMILIGFTILASTFLPYILKGINDVVLFRQIILILGISVAFGFPMRIFSGILIAHIRYDLVAIVEIIQLLVRSFLVWVFLKNGYGILALAFITLGVNWFGYIVNYLFVKRVFTAIKFSRFLIDIKKIKSFFNYSVFTFISQIADRLKFNMSYFVIGGFLGISFVTLYSIASRLILYFIEFMGSAIGMMLPVFSQYESRGDFGSIREKYIFVNKISGYLAILIGCSILFFGRPFIYRWMGPEYIYSYTILVVLLIPIIFSTMQGSVFGLLLGISKHKFYAWMNLGEGIANFILSIILVNHFGLIGVAFGTAIPMFIAKVFIQPVYVCKVINLSIKRYLKEAVIPVIARSTLILGLAWLVLKPWIMPDYIQLLIISSIQTALFAFTIYFIGFNVEEKKYFLNILFINRK